MQSTTTLRVVVLTTFTDVFTLLLCERVGMSAKEALSVSEKLTGSSFLVNSKRVTFFFSTVRVKVLLFSEVTRRRGDMVKCKIDNRTAGDSISW